MYALTSLLSLLSIGTASHFEKGVREGAGKTEDRIESEWQAFFAGTDGQEAAMQAAADMAPRGCDADEPDLLSAFDDAAFASDAAPSRTRAGFSIDDLIERDDEATDLIDQFDERQDALFVVYDAAAHPNPVLSIARSTPEAPDAMLLLDGKLLAIVSGGAELSLDSVNLVPDTALGEALAAGA
jgi:hypothetical protein